MEHEDAASHGDELESHGEQDAEENNPQVVDDQPVLPEHPTFDYFQHEYWRLAQTYRELASWQMDLERREQELTRRQQQHQTRRRGRGNRGRGGTNAGQ